jgi:uncharacterized lipoprotein YddW (UPF0748 family)
MRKIIGITIILLLIGTTLSAEPLSRSKESVKGTWLTISGSDAAYSVEGIIKAVARCKKLGLNTIYFAVWNQSMTNFIPSKKLQKKYPFVKMNPTFEIDPLKTLIREAHRENIKVVAWFEYGFATSYNDPTGGPILEAKPDWKAIDRDGNLATKNNFQWMNALDPKVQNFMLSIIMDVVKNYNIDGIQGDDRLPALPSLAGYDKYTVKKYKKSHNGQRPPQDYKDAEWVQWRCVILNKFMKKIHKKIKKYNKKHKKSILVTVAPSVYPWSKNEYLQDWPTWVNKGWVDYVFPQIYRYSLEAYETTLKDTMNYIDKDKMDKFCPGVLIGVGGNQTANLPILKDMLETNRKYGINGEVFFYYESLVNNDVAEIIKNEYKNSKKKMNFKTNI